MRIFEKIHDFTNEIIPEMVRQRRDFHKYAELGWSEFRTSSLIARQLTELGYEVLVGKDIYREDTRLGVPGEQVLEQDYQRALAQGADAEFAARMRGGLTGVIGILHCGEGPTVAMRFDIDALGVVEAEDMEHFPAREGFASVNPGAMHACGHDAHGTIGLGVAKVLMQIKDSLHGTVKLIFQPAEEGVMGAKAIVENGHLDNVQYMLASHVTKKAPEDPAVVIPGCYGALATRKYDVTYRGKSAHAGGSPHNGNNALLAAASAVMNLHAIPRHGEGATRVNVGRLIAGSGRNVIADEAFIELEVRGATTELNNFMTEYAERILQHCAEMHGCTCAIRLMGAADSLESDEALCRQIAKICQEDLKMPVGNQLMMRSGGSEDVAFMMNRVQAQGGQAAFMRILTPTAAGSHNRRFDIGEEVMPNAVKLFCGTAYDILK